MESINDGLVEKIIESFHNFHDWTRTIQENPDVIVIRNHALHFDLSFWWNDDHYVLEGELLFSRDEKAKIVTGYCGILSSAWFRIGAEAEAAIRQRLELRSAFKELFKTGE